MEIINTETLVKQVLTEDAQEIRGFFLSTFSTELEDFVTKMAIGLDLCAQFQESVDGDDSRETVYWLLLNAAQSHLSSMRIFVDGYFAPSCSLQRHVIESIAMALLASKPELGFAKRFINEEYSSSKAIQHVIRHAGTLNVNTSAMEVIKQFAKFYDRFNHPTLMTIASYNSFDKPEKRMIGGDFDQAKIESYKTEIDWRVKLAETLCGVISGIREEMESPSSR